MPSTGIRPNVDTGPHSGGHGCDALEWHTRGGGSFECGLPHAPYQAVGAWQNRVFAVPPALWRTAFVLARPFIADANVAMGNRMAKDMVFDPAPAMQDFGWNPREFRPRFN